MHGLRTRQRRFGAVVAGSLAVGLLLAACGSDSGGSNPTSGNSAGNTGQAGPKPDKSAIKIGVAVTLTGSASSSYFGVVPTAKAWAKWVNETQGGVNGHPVEIVVKDTKGDAGATLAAGNEMFSDSSLLAMLITDSQAEGVLADPTAKAGVPVIGGSTSDSKVNGVKLNYFTTGSMNPYYLEGLLIAGKASGGTKVGSVIAAESPVSGEIVKLFNGVATQLGLKFVGSASVSASAPNYTAACLSLINEGTDFATVTTAAAVLQRVAKDCVAQGYKGMFGAASQSVIPKVFDEVDGLKMAGTIHGFPWWSTAAPVQKYLGVMKGYLSKSDYDGQTYANTSATNVWTSLELFRKVNTKLSDTPTRAEVTSAYHTVKDETLDGLLPQPISYPDGKPTPPINCFWSWKYTDKKFTTVEPEGKSGNGQTGDLATSCFPLSK